MHTRRKVLRRLLRVAEQAAREQLSRLRQLYHDLKDPETRGPILQSLIEKPRLKPKPKTRYERIMADDL